MIHKSKECKETILLQHILKGLIRATLIFASFYLVYGLVMLYEGEGIRNAIMENVFLNKIIIAFFFVPSVCAEVIEYFKGD